MKISPLNESGDPVDWWFIYKVPRAAQENISGIGPATGYEYAYYDDVLESVQASPFKMDSGKGALNATLNEVFNAKSETAGWILYNDEHPPEVLNFDDNGALGHTKGALLFDVDTKDGMWLLHSWPKYVWPDAPEMPTPMFGQTFLCLALTLSDIEALAAQMIKHQQPEVFASQLPKGLAGDSPIAALAKGVDLSAAGESSFIDLATRGTDTKPGLKFKVIAKNRKWGKDFWNELVAPTLGVDINVETWIRGGPKVIPDTLDDAKVHTTSDIKFITLQAIGLPWAWPEVEDHAKWAISKTDNWICVGDINRMISQRKRGGCTIAFQDKALWDLMSQTDLINAPAGMDHHQAVSHVQQTHEHINPETKEKVNKAPGTWKGDDLTPPAKVSPDEAKRKQRQRMPLVHHGHDKPKVIKPVGKSTYGSILGTIDKSTEKQIQGKSGEHLQFYVQMYGSTRYQVDTNVKSKDGTQVGVHVGDEALPVASIQPPFGPEMLGFFPNATLSYRELGLKDADFIPFSDSRLETQLEGALNDSAYVAVYGFVFDDGGPNGKGIHENHFNKGKPNQDGGVAVYMLNSEGQPIRRWFFFKFQSDAI